MTEADAFRILKCEYLDEVQDAFDEAIFEYKAKFLQQIPPLKLIGATKKKVERINSAYYFLNPIPETESVDIECDEGDCLLGHLEKYQVKLAKIRLGISRTNNGHLLLDWIDKLVVIQSNLFTKLAGYLTTNRSNIDGFPIKLSTEIDVFKLQVELKGLQIDDTKISEYICKQINELDFEQFAYITQAVINAEKQMIFNGLRREV